MENAEVVGPISLRATSNHQFETLGEIRLSGAKIGGQINCTGARMENLGGAAFVMDGADLKGSIFFDSSDEHRFEAKGEVRLVGAKIGGQVGCAGALFENPDGDALSMDTADVTADVFLQASDKYRFEANGAVRLSGAKIGGDISCVGARFANNKGAALSMDNIIVTGSVYLRSSERYLFESIGEVRLLGARIGGQINCTGAHMENPAGTAFVMDGADVTGALFFDSLEERRFEARGEVRLLGVRIKGQVSCAGALFENPDGDALSMDAADVTADVFFQSSDKYRFEANGTVRLSGAKIGGLFGCTGARLTNPKGAALLMDNTTVTGSVYLRQSDRHRFETLGEVWLSGTKIGGQVSCTGARMENPGGTPNADNFFPQPHDQLAKVLQSMGHGYDARRITNHKFAHENHCGADEHVSRLFMRLYRWGFGCGYLPIRALVTVLLWLALGWIGVSVALDENDRHNVVLVRAATGVELIRSLSKPEEYPKSPTLDEGRDRRDPRGWILAPHSRIQAREIPCDEISPLLYALDTMLPVVDLHMEEKCEFSNDEDGPWWRFGKAVYALIGWVIVAMAALTWTGVLRREPA